MLGQKLASTLLADKITPYRRRPRPNCLKEVAYGAVRVDVVRRHAGQLPVSALSATYLGGRVTSRSLPPRPRPHPSYPVLTRLTSGTRRRANETTPQGPLWLPLARGA